MGPKPIRRPSSAKSSISPAGHGEEGILALEKEIPNVQDTFFAKALSMAVDGLEPKVLYETMETEMSTIEEEWENKGQGLGMLRRLFPHLRHHRRRARPHSGYEKS